MKKKRIICNRLKGLMVERGIDLVKLSKMVGKSENALTLKINGYRDWWAWEIFAIVKAFKYTEIKEVFPELYEVFTKAS